MKTNRLRVLRAERRLTQMAVARKILVGTYRYWQIENGYIDPTQDERSALAEVFGVSEDAVFSADQAAAS